MSNYHYNRMRVVLWQNHVEEAMEMYQEMHMWDEAIEVAEAKVGAFSVMASMTWWHCR